MEQVAVFFFDSFTWISLCAVTLGIQITVKKIASKVLERTQLYREKYSVGGA